MQTDGEQAVDKPFSKKTLGLRQGNNNHAPALYLLSKTDSKRKLSPQTVLHRRTTPIVYEIEQLLAIGHAAL